MPGWRESSQTIASPSVKPYSRGACRGVPAIRFGRRDHEFGAARAGADVRTACVQPCAGDTHCFEQKDARCLEQDNVSSGFACSMRSSAA
jgi:hypothetical protein